MWPSSNSSIEKSYDGYTVSPVIVAGVLSNSVIQRAHKKNSCTYALHGASRKDFKKLPNGHPYPENRVFDNKKKDF
jgi:hypothetical protein